MKKNTLLKSGIALLLGLGIGLDAQAAEPVAKLTQLEGKVLVNNGKSFTQAQVGMPLERGYRILIPAGGSAQVVYKDGCVLPLGQNSLLTVEGKNQCSEGAIVAQLNPGVRLAQAGGGPVTTTAPASTVPMVGGIPVPALIAAGVVAGVVAVGATSGNGGGGGGNNNASAQ